MKRILIVALVVTFASSLLPAQTTNKKTSRHTNLEKEITRVEEEWHSAFVKHDATILERVLADEFINVGGNGKSQNKTETIANLKGDSATYEYFTPYDLDIRDYGETVVVIGRSKAKGQYPSGSQFMNEYRWTDVFVKRQGRWQCVAAQVTSVPAPKSD